MAHVGVGEGSVAWVSGMGKRHWSAAHNRVRARGMGARWRGGMGAWAQGAHEGRGVPVKHLVGDGACVEDRHVLRGLRPGQWYVCIATAHAGWCWTGMGHMRAGKRQRDKMRHAPVNVHENLHSKRAYTHPGSPNTSTGLLRARRQGRARQRVWPFAFAECRVEQAWPGAIAEHKCANTTVHDRAGLHGRHLH